MIEISVIIPTYNRRERLQCTLESVLQQEDVGFEVIVVDDGSGDGTVQMIKRDFPQVCYLYQENRGPAAARNRGIENAKAKWIAFCDSDDTWQSGKLKAQLGFFKNNPDYLICQTEEIWIRNGKRVNPMKKHKKYGGWIFNRCLPLCIISPSAVMMHRKLFDEIGTFDESLPACEDYDLWLRVSAKHPVGLIPYPYVIKSGGHKDQRSKQFPAMDRFRIQSLFKLLSLGALDEEKKKAVEATLEEKSRIYIQGALKRGKTQEAEEIQNLIHAAL